jgi:hypothetical protein
MPNARPALQLPPEIAGQLDSHWQQNEASYWTKRERLLSQYPGLWIGFADGKVIASGSSPVAVFHAAEATAQSPFVTCVGHEDEPCRMRTVSFDYDRDYPGEALPVIELEFRKHSGGQGVTSMRSSSTPGRMRQHCPGAIARLSNYNPRVEGPAGWRHRRWQSRDVVLSGLGLNRRP